MTATAIDRPQLVREVEALQVALAAQPKREALDKAIYHCERLKVALRTSHTEGTRFAAFTLAKIVRDLAADLPPVIVERMNTIKAALEASGIDLHK